MAEPTNKDRVRRARTALQAYCAFYGETFDEETDPQDLISDLLHLITAQREKDPMLPEWFEVIKFAGNRFEEESAVDGEDYGGPY